MNIVEKYFHLLSEKSDYLVKTFGNLLVQLGVTYYVALKFTKVNFSFFVFILIVLVDIAIIYAIHATDNMPLQFLMFLVFSFNHGLFLKLFTGNNNKLMTDVVKIVAVVFSTMFILGGFLLAGGIQFGFMTIVFMMIGLLILITLVLFGEFVNPKSLNWIYTLGIVLFAAFIAIDTNFILQDNYQKDHTPIEASLKYYLDILNLYNFVKGKKRSTLR